MLRFRSGVLALCASLILAAAFTAGPLQAETLLISVRETVDGKSTLPPLPAIEGASSSLFEKGHIVFDAGKGDAGKKTSELAEVARVRRSGMAIDDRGCLQGEAAGAGRHPGRRLGILHPHRCPDGDNVSGREGIRLEHGKGKDA